MNLALLQPTYDGGTVALSVLIAAFASYVALDLARRVRAGDSTSVAIWTVAGALVMGSGIWSMHFVGMLAMSLPMLIGYDPLLTFLSWVAAVAVSVLALYIAARDSLSLPALAAGALTMGAGICAMHYTGMAALQMAPGIVWNGWLVAASAVIAVTASAVALIIFFGLRRLSGVRRFAAQSGAALVMGLAISGMHYTGMAAAGFLKGSVCVSADGLGGRNLATLVVFATLILMSITLSTAVLDARTQARATRLARSLEQMQGANQALQRLAFVDPLTGVPNRALFEDRLNCAIARIDRSAAQPGHRTSLRLAVLFIDLDGFKAVNDSYGHAAGDAVLQQLAQRLRRIAREVDTLARVGGDEFLLLLEDVSGVADAMMLAGRVLSVTGRSFDLPGRRHVSLSCSIGVVVYPDHVDRAKLVASADAAMYTAKRAGGGNYAVFEPRMREGVSEPVELQQALREALECRNLQLLYQPKVDSRTGAVRGVEALLRWTHPTRGSISPAEFIPIAERFGLIVPIGNWVIEEACSQLARWAAAGLRLRVSINLSAFQLRQPDVVARLQQALHRHRVDAEQLICEITESVAMENTRDTQRVIEQVSALGVRLSIDDFGTGYSSLAYLRQLRVHELKIDRSFVKDVASDADARAVADAVVRMAHALGLRVVAEGVETREQRDAVIALGCDELQGSYFARPMTATELADGRLVTADGAESVRFSPSVMLEPGLAELIQR